MNRNFGACKKCGGTAWKILPPKPPHVFAIRCSACGHHEWLSKERAAAHGITEADEPTNPKEKQSSMF